MGGGNYSKLLWCPKLNQNNLWVLKSTYLLSGGEEQPKQSVSSYDKVYTKLLTFSSKWAVSKIVLMINWFLNLISICIRVTGIHFVLQNSFISSYFPNFQCKFEFSALMEFFSSCAQRRFFLINYNAVCFLIIFPLNLMHKPQWEK